VTPKQGTVRFPQYLLFAAMSCGAFAQSALQSAAESPAAKVLWSETIGQLELSEPAFEITDVTPAGSVILVSGH
jgi:hypothetical protein